MMYIGKGTADVPVLFMEQERDDIETIEKVSFAIPKDTAPFYKKVTKKVYDAYWADIRYKQSKAGRAENILTGIGDSAAQIALLTKTKDVLATLTDEQYYFLVSLGSREEVITKLDGKIKELSNG